MSEQKHTPTPWHWEYHPVEGHPIALIGADGKDAMLATENGEHLFLEFAHEGNPAFMLDTFNAHAALSERVRELEFLLEKLCLSEKARTGTVEQRRWLTELAAEYRTALTAQRSEP